jgi:mannose-6-phosphate isomerase-like protein (cupin superfamily)
MSDAKKNWLVSLQHFRKQLGRDGEDFFVGMRHGTMRAELYKPVGRDAQTPHSQDELYIVLQGSGTFAKNGERRSFQPGDVIFVEARAEHRFENFSEDFETWVVFWGPDGGE